MTDCGHRDCGTAARYLPVLRLRAWTQPGELRQVFGGLACCERHRAWARGQLLADPWFSGYARRVEARHKFLPALSLSRVGFVDCGQVAEAL